MSLPTGYKHMLYLLPSVSKISSMFLLVYQSADLSHHCWDATLNDILDCRDLAWLLYG